MNDWDKSKLFYLQHGKTEMRIGRWERISLAIKYFPNFVAVKFITIMRINVKCRVRKQISSQAPLSSYIISMSYKRLEINVLTSFTIITVLERRFQTFKQDLDVITMHVMSTDSHHRFIAVSCELWDQLFVFFF